MTTAVAITIGLSLGTLLEPGAGLNMVADANAAAVAKEAPSLVSTIINLIPKNLSKRWQVVKSCRLSSSPWVWVSH